MEESRKQALHVDRFNNFDFLRVLFALMVIVTHSYDAYGLEENDWLNVHTHGLVPFSSLGVSGFFVVSGCLVYQSMLRSDTYRGFMLKRCLRVLPGLGVMLVLVALVLGAVVYDGVGYYWHSSPYTYIIRGITLFNMQGVIPGVFVNNPYPLIINASLWTIPYEFLLYLLFFVFYLGGRKDRPVVKGVAVLFIGLFVLKMLYPKDGVTIPLTSIATAYLLNFALWFIAGMLLGHTMPWWKRYKVWVAIVSALAMLLLLRGKIPFLAIHIIWPTLVVSFGSCRTPIISRLERVGDPSYGIYIWGWPIQQTLMYYLGRRLGFYEFMSLSALLSVIIGYASWYGIEKWALRFKKGKEGKRVKEIKKVIK